MRIRFWIGVLLVAVTASSCAVSKPVVCTGPSVAVPCPGPPVQPSRIPANLPHGRRLIVG